MPSFPFVDALSQDVRFAARLLVKDRWFTAAAVLVLGAGIGVNTTIFTIINGMSWRGLPVEKSWQILQIASVQLEGRRQEMYTSSADFRDWQAAAQSVSGLAAYAPASMNIGDEQRPADRLEGNLVTANAFSVLGVPPILGRDFTADDDRPGAAPVVILSYGVWSARYGADPSIVGRAIRVNGTPTTVIGVMPEGFRFPLLADLWQPSGLRPGVSGYTRDDRWLNVFGRMRDGVTLEQTRAEMTAIAAALAEQYPDTNKDVGARTVPFTEAYVRPPSEEGPPILMTAAAAFVLLIACANVANLLLARAAYRAREIALRAALGASRARVVRQLLVESVLLAALAGAVGLAVALAVVPFFADETVDLHLPHWIAFEFDVRVFAYLAAVCLGTAIAFGLAPAWRLARTAAHEVLKEGGRGGAGSARTSRWSSGLLIGELALTLVLLAGAGLLVRSGRALSAADAVLDTRNLVTARLALPPTTYATPDQRRAFYARVEERLNGVGSIGSAAVASARPYVDAQSRELILEGEAPSDRRRTVQLIAVGDRYFATLNVPLRRGRALGPADGLAGPDAVVINERFASQHFPGVDPLGQRLRLRETSAGASPGPWLTIVGVSPPVRQQPMGDVAAVVYIPLRTDPRPNGAVLLRGREGASGSGDADALVSTLREELRALDPDVAAFNIETLDRLSEKSRWIHRILGIVFAVVALVATMLSAVGLYAVTAFGVSQRTSEIGIRIALGANRSQVAWLLLRRTLLHLLVGLSIGIAGALGVGQLLRGILIRTSATDPATFAGIVLLLVVVAAAASYFPARRALRLDPVAALRHD